MFSLRLPPVTRRFCPFVCVMLCAVPALAQSSGKHHPGGKPSPSPAATSSPTASPASAYVLPDTVATVDGQPLHREDLERVANVLLANQGRTIQALHDEDRKKVYQSVLDDMITDRLVNREAVRETVNDLDVEKRFNELRAAYPTPEGFDNEIKKSNQTPDQVRQNLRIQLAQQQWIEHQIADDIKVTPQEIEKFYKEGPPDKFDAPEMIRASHILAAVSKTAPPEDALAAEQKIDALPERIKKGESFEEVAKANSDDPVVKTSERPGDLGYFSRERIMPEFADVAFKMKVGEVSPPVRTQFGYHLIKVTDHQPAHTATLDQARPQVAEYLQDEKRRVAVAKLVQTLREKANVKTFLP